MMKTRARAHAQLGLMLIALCTVSARAGAQTSTVAAGPPSGAISTASPTVTVPVTLARTTSTPVLGFSVTLTLSPELSLPAGNASIVEGPFVGSNGASTSYHVTHNPDDSYTVDDVTLGVPCGTTSTGGTLFTLTLSSGVPSGTGTVTLTQVRLRDCNNAPLPSSIGSSASLTIDNTAPSAAVTSPNGGEVWPGGSAQTIGWSASDASGVASVDLDYSTDGGLSFSNAIASGLANSGSFLWTVPNTPTANARVRVTVRDAFGNVASDASDGDFTIGIITITATASGSGNIVPSGAVTVGYGASQMFSMTPASGQHLADVVVDGGSVGVPNPYTFSNVTSNHSIVASFTPNPPVPPITDLSATQVKTGNDADGTTKIRLGWSPVAAGSTVEVYRAGFGNYPEYDDDPGAGSEPPIPSYPPVGRWNLTSVSSPGQTDEVAARDFYYFVAFVTDGFGTHSPVSNMTSGTLNYYLGDVSNGFTTGQGDNFVSTPDVSLLGAHYGASGAALDPVSYLDVGPTTDLSVDARPTTDDRVNFEDLAMFAINYRRVSSPQSAVVPDAPPSQSDGLSLRCPDRVRAGEVVHAGVVLAGSGHVQALSIRLGWDPTVVEPVGFVEDADLEREEGVAMSAEPGTVDVALLGARSQGLIGTNALASLTFRALRDGEPAFRLLSAEARDARNHTVAITLAEPAAAIPSATALAMVAPNPSRGETALDFTLARDGLAALEIYSVEGRRVRTLFKERRAAGAYRASWDGRDDHGRVLTAGLYYARLVTAHGTFARAITYLK